MKKKIFVCILIVFVFIFNACKKQEEIVYVAPTPKVETSTVILERENEQPHYIEVAGNGEYIAAPDYASITLKVSAQGKTAEEATQLCLEEAKKVIKNAFTFGIYSRNINQRGVELEQVMNETETEVLEYIASDILTIKVEDITKVEYVSASLVDIGNYETPVITYSILDVTEAYKHALDDAVQDAKNKAEIIAAASDMQIKNVLSLTEVPAQESTYTDHPYDSSQIIVSAAVTARYEVTK